MTSLDSPCSEKVCGPLKERQREMRAEDILPAWLLDLSWPVIGFEGEGGTGTGSGTGSETETEEETEEGTEEEEEEEEDEGSKETAGLRSALKKERLARREAQKGLKTLQKQFEDLQAQQAKGEKDEESQTKQKAETATTKLERVSAGFVRNALDTALVRALQDPKAPKFQDHDDVLRLINRDDIDVDQDDDDPSKVTVDAADLKQALKDLAKKKPHLLIKEEGEGGQGTGSSGEGGNRTGKFGGSGSKTSAETRRAELIKKYPALQHR